MHLDMQCIEYAAGFAVSTINFSAIAIHMNIEYWTGTLSVYHMNQEPGMYCISFRNTRFQVYDAASNTW